MKFITRDDIILIRHRIIAEAGRDGGATRVFGLSRNASDVGVKNENNLRSALDRQHVGHGRVLKYDSPLANAASLAYGLCKNHAFHDGNKRTALIAMLAHLDKNKLLLPGIKHKTLVYMMENIAMNLVPVDTRPARRAHAQTGTRSDVMVADIARFLGERSRPEVRSGFRSMTYRKLRKLLTSRGFELEGPISGNRMTVFRTKRRTVLRSSKRIHVNTIAWPGDSRSIDQRTLDRVRMKLGLRAEDGFDDASFYDLEEAVEGLVNEYRNVLKRLETR